MKHSKLVVLILVVVFILSLFGCGGGSTDREFDTLAGVAVASDGSVYVADTDNDRIQKFTSEGVFVGQWGTRGSGEGEFQYPTGIAVASDGSVYVTDWRNH